MRYLIEEFWFEDRPTGNELIEVVADNHLGQYELFEIETKPKPHNPNMLYFNGPGNWYIVRFRKKET